MALTADELGPPLSDAAIVEKIVSAVMEQKLSAGAKLPEAALCDAFDCSRSQIRRILVVLAERGVVALQANRGAYVASPDDGAAREVFEARDPAFYRALRNDRLLAVAVHAKLHADLKSIKELNPRVLDEVEAFFRDYKQMDGKEFHEAQEASGKKQAA